MLAALQKSPPNECQSPSDSSVYDSILSGCGCAEQLGEIQRLLGISCKAQACDRVSPQDTCNVGYMLCTCM